MSIVLTEARVAYLRKLCSMAAARVMRCYDGRLSHSDLSQQFFFFAWERMVEDIGGLEDVTEDDAVESFDRALRSNATSWRDRYLRAVVTPPKLHGQAPRSRSEPLVTADGESLKMVHNPTVLGARLLAQAINKHVSEVMEWVAELIPQIDHEERERLVREWDNLGD